MDLLIWGFALLIVLSFFSAMWQLVGAMADSIFGKTNTPTSAEKKLAKIEELLAQIEQIQQEHKEHLAQMQAMDEEHNRIMAERFRTDRLP